MTEMNFRDSVDLASERVGGSVLFATDDFFAEKENLLKPHKPIWKEHEYTDRGKWMDGWESRRKRTPGHDFVVVRLGMRGVIRGVVVDTSFFRGNFPDQCFIEACDVSPETSLDELEGATWREVLTLSKLNGDSENIFEISDPHAWTHLRFHILPDGGVARLRVHGQPVADWKRSGGLRSELDLAAVEHGADVLACSDMFFGPKHNLIMPGRALNMSDGWETKRRRGPGHDWVIVRLAAEGTIRRIEIDTNHFKGNYPDSCSIEASVLAADADAAGADWFEILPRTKLQAHSRHMFVDELAADDGPVTHLRLNVYPDGGVSRMRVHGVATAQGRRGEVVRRVNTLADAEGELRAACGSTGWVREMIGARPFRDWDHLAETSEKIWKTLSKEDWLEAFRSHPRIGETRSLHQGAAANRWSGLEQKEAISGAEKTRAELIEGNREYEKRFGHLFIVCATGKSGEEIVGILQQRMNNSPAEEIRQAKEEQKKITLLRLERLVG